jgi:hypothetical protein
LFGKKNIGGQQLGAERGALETCANPAKVRFPNVDPGSVVATVSSEVIALSAASKTEGITDPVTNDPPETGPGGSDVSPSFRP